MNESFREETKLRHLAAEQRLLKEHEAWIKKRTDEMKKERNMAIMAPVCIVLAMGVGTGAACVCVSR